MDEALVGSFSYEFSSVCQPSSGLPHPLNAQYTTSAAAEAARAAIHDIKFPADTGRQLHVGLVLSDLVARMIPEEERALQERRKIDWEAMLLSGGPETRDEDQEEKEIDFSTVPTEPAAMRERGRLGGNPLGLVQKQLQKGEFFFETSLLVHSCVFICSNSRSLFS